MPSCLSIWSAQKVEKNLVNLLEKFIGKVLHKQINTSSIYCFGWLGLARSNTNIYNKIRKKFYFHVFS